MSAARNVIECLYVAFKGKQAEHCRKTYIAPDRGNMGQRVYRAEGRHIRHTDVFRFGVQLPPGSRGVLFFKSFKRFNLKVLPKGSLTGVAVAAAYALQTIGLEHTTPGINAFLTAVYCVITPFMMWAITRRRPSVFRFAAAAACFAGVGLVSMGSMGGFTFMGEAGEPLAARLGEKHKKPKAETNAGSNTAPAPNGENDSGAG